MELSQGFGDALAGAGMDPSLLHPGQACLGHGLSQRVPGVGAIRVATAGDKAGHCAPASPTGTGTPKGGEWAPSQTPQQGQSQGFK